MLPLPELLLSQAFLQEEDTILQVLSPAEREAVFAFLTRNVEELRALAPFEIPLKVGTWPSILVLGIAMHYIM